MNLVLQRTDDDCGVAVFAMIAGLPYEAAHRSLARHRRRRRGTSNGELARALMKMGFRADWRIPKEGEAWPPAPFAPAHFAMVQVVRPHFVAVDQDGAIYDPAGMPPAWWWPRDPGHGLPLIQNAPAGRVLEVWGFWRR